MAIDKVAGLASAALPAGPVARFQPLYRAPVEGRLGAAPKPVRVEGIGKVNTPALRGQQAIDEVLAAQRRLDRVLCLAQSGRGFSPAELLALQTNVYRASQELDLAGKLVEKATSGLKQVLQTQV